MLSLCVYPSVCPSICPSHAGNTKTDKRRITQTRPYDSAEILVFWSQRSQWNSTRVTQTGRQIEVRLRWIQIGNFRLTSRYISEAVEDRISIIHLLWNTYREGTPYMRSIEWRYFQWPSVTLNYPKPPHFRYFVSLLVYSEWVEIETSNLVHRLIVTSASPRVTNHPWRGVVKSHETF